MGRDVGIDLLALMDVGERYVRPLVRRRGVRSLDVVCGLAQFHSSYLDIIHTVAGRYRVDPRRLIIEVCKEDRVNAPVDLVERCALKLREEAPTTARMPSRFLLEEDFEPDPGAAGRPRRAAG
jgi:hypothetical protein